MFSKKFILAFILLAAYACAHAQATFTIDSTLIKTNLAPKIWTTVSQSVINIRRAPDFRAEMTTQAILGTPLKILATYRSWTMIETPEGYTGWTSAPIQSTDFLSLHAYNKLPKVVVMQNNTMVFLQPHRQSDILSEVVMGSILRLNKSTKKKGFYEVAFPDGRSGFIAADAVLSWSDWKKSIALTGSSIEAVAKHFLGVPYFWGGTSARGLDCSGLTKTTYLMHGIILPRDARQQYLTGLSIDSSHHFSLLQKGDLLFFGSKDRTDTTKYNIVHTGIYLQNQQFINATGGYVQVGSLNPADENYDSHNHNRYVVAKRILNQPANGFWSIFAHPWYQ